MRKILVLTGSRGEWGYLRPVVAQLESQDVEVNIVATNMHVDPRYGSTSQEILRDGFKLSETVPMNVSYDGSYAWTSSLGVFGVHWPSVLERNDPDIVLLAGDRAETMIAASLAYYTKAIIAHIQAGDLSGHKDGLARHAIGKLSHIHFASNKDSAERLRRLGEQEFRIFNVGAPQIDDIVDPEFIKRGDEVLTYLRGFDVTQTYAICSFHASSDDGDSILSMMNTTKEFLDQKNISQIWILPNSDHGSDLLEKNILNYNRKKTWILRNIARHQFIYLLKNSTFIIGNSSAGILEAPSLGTWSINIGQRQAQRYRSKTVIDLDNVTNKNLQQAVKTTENSCPKSFNFGDGDSAREIAQVLINIEINEKLKNKILEE